MDTASVKCILLMKLTHAKFLANAINELNGIAADRVSRGGVFLY